MAGSKTKFETRYGWLKKKNPWPSSASDFSRALHNLGVETLETMSLAPVYVCSKWVFRPAGGQSGSELLGLAVKYLGYLARGRHDSPGTYHI
eukprot:12075869-Heterocapsa_arctica.AAC.1